MSAGTNTHFVMLSPPALDKTIQMIADQKDHAHDCQSIDLLSTHESPMYTTPYLKCPLLANNITCVFIDLVRVNPIKFRSRVKAAHIRYAL